MKALAKIHSPYKEMTIRRTPNGKLPQLPLNGKWLEELGFTCGTPVVAMFEDSCLTLTTFDVNTIHYRANVLMVESRLVRGKPRTYLTLDGFLLRRYGFNVGDRVVLHLSPNMIQISRITNFTLEERDLIGY